MDKTLEVTAEEILRQSIREASLLKHAARDIFEAAIEAAILQYKTELAQATDEAFADGENSVYELIAMRSV